jgi:anti-sigma factor RsiW
MEELLRARLDGELDAEGERRLARAEEGDPALAAEARELSRLVASLANLSEEIEPPRDLLPGILARTAATPAPRKWLVAAALVAGVGAAFLAGRWTVPSRGETAPAPVARLEPVPAVATSSPTSSLAAATSSLVNTRRELRRAFDGSRAELPPETLALIEENLATIERAIAEIEAAVATDPSNRELGRMLVAYQTREIALLQQAHRVATRL